MLAYDVQIEQIDFSASVHTALRAARSVNVA